jgi:hypothetical protein
VRSGESTTRIAALADLVLRQQMSTRVHPIGDAGHRHLFRDEQDVQHDGVARGVRGVDQLDLGGWENTVSAMKGRPGSTCQRSRLRGSYPADTA